MRVRLVVPTYRRNVQLVRLLGQISDLRSRYVGDTRFEVIVTDSDAQNRGSHVLQSLCDRYVINPGIGFDDNLLHAYANCAEGCDFIFSISDDDLFSHGAVNPLDLLELAAKQGPDAVLFNHCEYRSPDMLAEDLHYALSPPFYANPLFSEQPAELRRHFLGYVPRHVGLLYRSSHLLDSLAKLSDFRRTLHLYAVPFMLALEGGSATFFNYPLNYFAAEMTQDGAWEDWAAVFHGLFRYLVAAKGVLSPDAFEIAKAGFMSHYLGDNAWLRSVLPGSMPSPASMLEELSRR